MIVATNPYSGKIISEHPVLSGEEIDQTIGAVHAAYPGWRRLSFQERAQGMRSVAAILRDRSQALAELMALEMGKPVKEGVPEVEKSAWCLEHYAEFAEEYLKPETLTSDASNSYVCHPPIGTLLGILPWNAPLWLAFRYLAPGLMAGNTCVMKHDPNVPGCAEAIAQVFADADVPANIMANLPLANEQIESAIRDPRIAGVSFTGSSGTGSRVAAIAGSEIKPMVLELGGSDPCIVMADADLDRAADVATLSRIINAGQSCIAAKRIIIEAAVYDQFTDKLKSRLAALKCGDPLSVETDVGPIARKNLRDNLARQVESTVDAGAKLVYQGEIPGEQGFFYPVTLLADVRPGMCAFDEETFGPVMSVVAAENLDDALKLANDTEYGLGAAIWTENPQSIGRAIAELEAGQVAVNGIVKTDPRLPSGGIKKSGLGRELGPHGIKAFVNIKQVWLK